MAAIEPDCIEPDTEAATGWVLVVESDPAARPSICAQWESAGFAVEVASSAKDALECLKVMTPSVVVVEGRTYRPGRR